MRTRVALATLLGLLAGCGGGDKPVPVAGRVTMGGNPLTKGHVVLVPDPDRGNDRLDWPMSEIRPDGTYAVGLRGEAGAVPGAYKVLVMSSKNKEEQRVDWVPIWAVHPRYTKPETTDLRIEVVPAPAPGAYDFEVAPP